MLQSLDNLVVCAEDISYSNNNIGKLQDTLLYNVIIHQIYLGINIATQSLTSTLLTNIDTSEIYGWTPPFISAHLQIDNMPVSHNVTFRFIVSVYGNVSDILPANIQYVSVVLLLLLYSYYYYDYYYIHYRNSQLSSDVIGIRLKYEDQEDPSMNNLRSRNTITFNHTTSLTVSWHVLICFIIILYNLVCL